MGKHNKKTVLETTPEAFSVVTSKAKGFVHHSPFYQLIANLKTENNPILPSIAIQEIHNESRQAFIIPIDSSPTNFLFLDYPYQERHFSIDRTYKTSEANQHGRTPIHYTETYFSKQTNTKIVVHGYLNRNGDYLYSQIKEYKDGSDESFSVLAANKELENNIRSNINTSKNILDPLLEERMRRYLELREEVEELESALANEFEQLSQFQGNLREYIKKAKLFIKAVEQLNQYSELAYSAASIIDILAHFEAWSKQFKEASKPRTTHAETPPVTSSALVESSSSIPTVSEQQNPQAMFNSVFDALRRDVQKLDSMLPAKPYATEDFKKINKKHALIAPIMQQLILIFDVPAALFGSQKEKSKKTGIISDAYSKIHEHQKQCFLLLEASALSGDLKTVSDIFELVKDAIKPSFYLKLLEKMVSSSSTDEQKKLMILCDFFHKNSEVYRNCVLKISTEMSSIISAQDFRNIMPAYPAKQQDALNISVLFKMYLDDNILLFTMLLEHGADPNTWSYSVVGVDRTPCTLFCSITTFEKTNYLDYLELLLTHKADMNLAYTRGWLEDLLREKLDNAKKIARLGRKNLSYEGTVADPIKPPVTLLAHRADPRGFNLVLRYGSVENIAHALACLTNDRSFNTKTFLSLEPALIIEDTNTSANQQYFLLKNDGGCFFCFIVYPGNTEAIKDRFSVGTEELLKKMKLMHENLIEKVSSLSSTQFNMAYNALFSRGENAFLQKKMKPAYALFYACEYLLIARSKSLRTTDISDLFDKYILKLTEKRIITEPNVEIMIKVHITRGEAWRAHMKAEAAGNLVLAQWEQWKTKTHEEKNENPDASASCNTKPTSKAAV